MIRLGDNYRRTPSAPGWDGPADEPEWTCPACGATVHADDSAKHRCDPWPWEAA